MRAHAVAEGAVREIIAGELAAVGGGIRELVVGHDHHQGQLFNGCLIQGLVERAGGGAAFAEGGHADHAGLTFHAAGKEHAIDHGNHRAEMADHGQETFAGVAAVDIAIAPAHGAEGGAHVIAHGIHDGFAKGQAAGGIADERGKDVRVPERNPDGRAQGFLAAAEKDAAVNLAGAVKRGKLVIEQAGAQHEAIGENSLLPAQSSGIACRQSWNCFQH